MRLIQGDCLEIMQELSDEGVKVDLVLTDPPYGTTACKWDTIIPFKEMWDRINELKSKIIVLFGNEPFSSFLRMSNIKNYRYDWIWNKKIGSNFLSAKKVPLKFTENISVFYEKFHLYNPQRVPKQIKYDATRNSEKAKKVIIERGEVYGVISRSKYYVDDGLRMPNNILTFNSQINETNNSNRVHPTQKPVLLLEYLIKTYTNPGDLVLDFTMGSGSTGVACYNTDRDFIGIELDKDYYNIAENRIKEARRQSKLTNFSNKKLKECGT